MVLTPPLKRVDWPAATRIIASRYPPIDLYERVSPDPAVWDALVAAEMLTNPRLRDEVGDIRLVPVEERVAGPGASYVMAPFTHLNPKGGRFSDATHGAYYAASDLPTAVAETSYHFARFAADAADGPRYEDMRVIVGRIDAELHDRRGSWTSPIAGVCSIRSTTQRARPSRGLCAMRRTGLALSQRASRGGPMRGVVPALRGRHSGASEAPEIPLGRHRRAPLF